MDHNGLRDYIRGFRLGGCAGGDQGYNRVLLQLFGYLGHGKSSFVNSCKYVLDGEYKGIAEAGEKQGGLTMERRSYKLTDTVTIVDNRGNDTSGFQTLEVYAQLGNFLPLDMKVEWTNDYDSFMEELENSDLLPNVTDLIVPVFVYSVAKPISEKEEADIKAFFKTCKDMTGIFPIVILTFKTSGKFPEFEQSFRCLGAEYVFAVENYTSEDHAPTRGKHTEILNILKNVIDDVKFRLEQNVRDPKLEYIERWKKLLSMAHSSEHGNKLREKINKKINDQNQSKEEGNTPQARSWCAMS